MDSQRVTDERVTPDGAEFVRFCHRRRPVGWPELYDEMCAVASRGLFRGWGTDELAEHGIGFSLFETQALAAIVSRVVAEEQATHPRGRAIRGTEPRHRRPADDEVGVVDGLPHLVGAAAS